MNRLSATLDILSLVIATSSIGWRIVRYRRIRVDHVLLFTLGFAYYVSLSSVLAHNDVLAGYFGNAFETFHDVAPVRRVMTSLWSALAITAFLAATWLAGRRPARAEPPASVRRIRASIVPATVVAAVALGLFLVAAVVYRAVLIQGYRSSDPTEIQAQAGRGTLAGLATASAIASLFALHAAVSGVARPAQRTLAIAVAALAIGVPVLVLPVGGNRLYSASLLLVVAVWASHRLRPVRRSVLLLVGLFGFGVLVALGSLRLGQIPSPSTTAYYASSESAFGGWSRDLYLASRSDPLPPIAVPKYLASDLINLAPRLLLPTKDQLRLDPAAEGFDIVSPLGGIHLTTSMFLNFGFLGSLAVIAALGAAMRRFQLRILADPGSSLTMTYAVLAAAMGLSLFRDGFGISVVRWGIVNAVVIVGVIHVATRVVAIGLTPARRPASSPAPG